VLSNKRGEKEMGLNFKSHRISTIKSKLTAIKDVRQEMPYSRQVALLTELLKISTISIRNCQWARKYISQNMREMYRDTATIREMDQLEELFTKAEERRIRRKEKKLAANAQGATTGTPGKRGRKPKAPPTTTPVIPATSPMALWQEMIEEKKS
jgi:hypothetical protein